MREVHNSFVGRTFLRSIWAYDYEAFKGSEDEQALEKRLVQWAARADLKETSAEGPFVEEFFRRTWAYIHSGQEGSDLSYTLYPKFPVPGAGAKGGPGEADLAIGYFTKGDTDPVPQVLCEFKDIKSALDAPQKSRKGGLSPVKQCLNYLSNARRGLFGNEPIIPQWGIVTDMNEFRLYWHDRAPQQFIRFYIRQPDLYSPGLLKVDGTPDENEEARFDRFLFWKIFHRDTLLTTGGKPLLVQLIAKQWVRERELEKAFYAEYRAYRERLIATLIEQNPLFPGTKGRLVRLAQKILDRCIFVFFCEDMGAALKFPAQLLRDFLIDRSRDAYFDPKGGTIWEDMKRLFRAMNTGAAFGPHKINQFNGGLFADDPELEALIVPNEVFCQHGQGQNEASLYAFKHTLLYFSASYNYAGGWAQGLPPHQLTELAGATATGEMLDGSRKKSKRLFQQSVISPTGSSLAQAEWATPHLGLELVRQSQFTSTADPFEAEAFRLYRETKFQLVPEVCEKWAKVDSFSIRPFEFGSTAAAHAGDLPTAEKLARMGLERRPSSPLLLNCAAYALASKDDTEQAEQHLRKVRIPEGDRLEPLTLANWGLVQFRKGDPARGTELYRAAVKRFSELENKRGSAHARVYLAREAVRANLPDALEMLAEAQSAMKLFPNSEAVAVLREVEIAAGQKPRDSPDHIDPPEMVSPSAHKPSPLPKPEIKWVVRGWTPPWKM